jgi:hypothetical protein
MARLSLDGDQFKQDWLSETAVYPNEWFAFNTHVIHAGHIYYLTKDRKPEGTGLSCVEAKTGQRKFFDTQYGFGNSLKVGNTMIMLDEEGELIWGKLGQASFKETHRRKRIGRRYWVGSAGPSPCCWAICSMHGMPRASLSASGWNSI